ncbi:cysteine-rich repeat secretory protein 9-like [Chenopodium quinoa]|uniref:Gnk2-homologous domain-containing protein n=1 Tax=Chenopodium quinoa TaxID=63459 RepID=A0A803KUI4_CHEQI|nr:cysteine-rich repeat secretory protein 9-like [Chenopodium quinoa]
MSISIYSNIKITLFFIVSIFLIRINSQPTHDIFGSCHGGGKDDEYKSQTDINKAITQLISNASNTYFSNISTGSGSDQFNALYYCRYDFSLQTCKSRVESAFEIARSCLLNKESDRYFEECMIYYSNNTISTEREGMSRMATSGGRNLTVEEQSNFRQILDKTISNLTNNVNLEFNNSSRIFATTSEKYSSTETLYAIGQCNPYIPSTNCEIFSIGS